MSDLLQRIRTISILMAVLLLVSCQNPTASPAATATPIPPTATAALPTATPIPATATAALPTATLIPATPPPVTEAGSMPTTLSQVPRIKPQQLKEKLDAGEDVIVVDARSRESYERLHIPGALSIPLPEVEERHGELSKEKKIVLYCT